MRNTFTIFLIAFHLPNFLFSQYQDLMKNKNITWIAEFEMDLSFDLSQSGDHTNELLLKKFIQPNTKIIDGNNNALSLWLYDLIAKGKVLSYKDATFESPMNIEQTLSLIEFVDTVITFDPATAEESIAMVRNKFDPNEIKAWRTKQILYFDKSKNSLASSLYAIAPLVNVNNIGIHPLVWVKMDNLFKTAFDENNEAVKWAATIICSAAPLDLSQLKVVKGNLNLRKQLYLDASSGSKKVENQNEGYNGGEMLSKLDIENIYSGSVDTIITFDPVTYIESVQIIKNEFKPTDINQLRLVQDWYYMPEKRLLANRLKAVAPLVRVTDENVEFRYLRPLYYILY